MTSKSDGFFIPTDQNGFKWSLATNGRKCLMNIDPKDGNPVFSVPSFHTLEGEE